MKMLPSLYAATKPKARCWLIWAAYLLMIAYAAIHHNVWADEADPWNMVTTAGWNEFWQYFYHTGHPPLWHFLLWPFAHVGAPVIVMGLIQTTLAASMAWLLLFRSPFALWLCLLLLFSHCLGFQYSVICRGYMLMTLLAFTLACAHPARLRRPLRYGVLLALLFNTESFIIIPTALLAGWFTLEIFRKENRKPVQFAAILIAGTGALFCLLCLWPRGDMLEYYHTPIYNQGRFTRNLVNALWSQTFWSNITTYLPWSSHIPFPTREGIMQTTAIAFLFALGAALLNTRWLFFYAAWISWLYFIFTYLYEGYFWHAQTVIVFAVWTLWFHHQEPSPHHPAAQKILCLFLIGLLSVGVIANIFAHKENAKGHYSGSKDMADFLKSRHVETATFISLACYEGVSVSAYLPDAKFWILGQRRIASFNAWGPYLNTGCMIDHNNRHTPELARLNQHAQLFVIASAPVTFPQSAKPILAHTAPGYKETFYFYVLPRKTLPAP